MVKSEESNQEKPAGNAVLQMILTMADTTWRMFVPILGLLILGILADKLWGTFPWLTIVGFISGALLSSLLIRNQLRKKS